MKFRLARWFRRGPYRPTPRDISAEIEAGNIVLFEQDFSEQGLAKVRAVYRRHDAPDSGIDWERAVVQFPSPVMVGEVSTLTLNVERH